MSTTKLRVMLVDDTPKEVSLLREALIASGFDVVAQVTSGFHLPEAVARVKPDAIIIDTESPTRDVLEQIVVVSQDSPKPIVMFTGDRENKTIQAAIKAGVTAYIVDGVSQARLKPIMDVALARFQADQSLREELASTQTKLADRKLIDRAKGILMKARRVDEDEAYTHMRKLAMDKSVRLADIAGQIIQASELIG